MNKHAFEISPLKAGLAATGLGGMGGIAGYMVARNRARQALLNQAQEFSTYNQQENQAIADDAFNQGAEYAVAAIKQSSLKGVQNMELEKDAGKKWNSFKNFIKDLYVSGIQDYRAASKSATGLLNEKKLKSAITEEQASKIREMLVGPTRTGLYRNVGAIGATAAGLGGAGYLAMRKQSSLDKEAGVKFQAAKAALKDLFYSSRGIHKGNVKAINKLRKSGATIKEWEKETATRSGAFRSALAKNVLMGGLGLTGVAGAGVAAHDLVKRSELSKEAKVSAIKDFLKKTYTGGFSAMRKFDPKKVSVAAAGEARSAYRQEIARNLLAMVGTAGVLGGTGYGIKKAID